MITDPFTRYISFMACIWLLIAIGAAFYQTVKKPKPPDRDDRKD